MLRQNANMKESFFRERLSLPCGCLNAIQPHLLTMVIFINYKMNSGKSLLGTMLKWNNNIILILLIIIWLQCMWDILLDRVWFLAVLPWTGILNFHQVWTCPKQSITEFLVIQIRRGSFLFIQQVMSQHKEVCPFFPLNMSYGLQTRRGSRIPSMGQVPADNRGKPGIKS